MSACAAIAFQSENWTGASKLSIRATCASFGISRKRPVFDRSAEMTRVMSSASWAAAGLRATKVGTAKGMGESVGSVIVMRSCACAAIGASVPAKASRAMASVRRIGMFGIPVT